MTIDVVIFLFIVGFASWFVFFPLIQNSTSDFNIILDNTADSQKLLQQKRSELMLSLRDLDFDFETGKLSKEDYQNLRKKYESETIQVLKKIDEEKSLWEKFQNKLNEESKRNDV